MSEGKFSSIPGMELGGKLLDFLRIKTMLLKRLQGV